jgi:hypothetical protein
MTVNLSALAGAGQQFFDNNGDPLSGGKLYSYEAGTTTPQITYTTAAGNVAHSNPIILDSAGRVPSGQIWLTAGLNYKFALKTSTEVQIATWDNITGINGTGITSNAINVEYDPAGLGAVPTNVQDKLRESVSVKDFGAVGDGVTDDTAAIQSALTASATSGGELLLNNGTYAVTALSVPSNVSFKGESLNAVLKNISTGVTNFVVIDGAENVTIKNITFDTNSRLGIDTSGAVAIALTSTSSAVNNTTITGCKFINGVIRPFIDVRNSIASTGLYITNNQFYGQTSLIPQVAPSPQNTGGVRMLSTASVSDIKIDNNYFSYIEIATQVRPSPTAKTYDFYTNFSWSGNVVTNVLDDPNVGATPLELFGATNVTVNNNMLDSGGRGLSAAWVKNGVYNNNTVKNQTIYFIEVQSSDGITVSNNTALNCKRFFAVTGISTDPGTSNVNIIGNVIKGGNLGIAGYNDTQNGFMIIMVPVASTGNTKWNIANNLFVDNTYTGQVAGSIGAGSIIRVDNPLSSDFIIANNQFIANDEKMALTIVSVVDGKNILIRGNNITRTADITTDTYAVSTSTFTAIDITNGATSPNIICEQNTIEFTGADLRVGGNGYNGIGAVAGAGVLPGCIIRNNRLIGIFTNPLFLNYTSTDTIVFDNNLDQAVGTNVINAAIVYRRVKKTVESTIEPAGGTWNIGDRSFNSVPVIGQPKSWACTVAGTAGTLTGTTGDITTGTTALVVNTATGLMVNQYITIAGVSGIKQITKISGTSITISSNADATVTGAAVAWSNPTFVSEGNL